MWMFGELEIAVCHLPPGTSKWARRWGRDEAKERCSVRLLRTNDRAVGDQCPTPTNDPHKREPDMSKLNPNETVIRLPDDILWKVPDDAPERSVAEATLAGGEDKTGLYLVLMKWYSGYMSAPHFYRTDRLCVVVSGVWWCNSGPDLDPDQAAPTYPGTFVKRVAGTPHYDGARRHATEPAVIAISGIGPVDQTWVDASLPPLRRI